MLTLNCIIEKKYPVGHVLTKEDKAKLLAENEGGDYSYYSLLREMLSYEVTISELLRGWGGVNLFSIS